MKSGVNVEVGEELVRPIIEAEIQTAIFNQLGSKSELLGTVISRLLSQRVDKNGKPASRSYDEEGTLIEFLSKKAIVDCATSAVNSWVESKKSEIQEEIEKQMSKKQKTISKLLVDGFAESLKNDYTVKIDLSFDAKQRY